MSQGIPIRNLYHLLLYALEMHPLSGLARTKISDAPDTVNLLARLLAYQVRSLRNRGLEQGYIDQREELGLLRGKLDFAESNRRLSRLRSRVVCEFEELSPNILPNRILKATLENLCRRTDLDQTSRDQLRVPGEMLKWVEPVPLRPSVFRRVTFHRNNRHYRVQLNLCRLIASCTMPTEEEGPLFFQGLTEDPERLHDIFEKFVRNFAAIHCPECDVSADHIHWDGHGLDESSRLSLPIMKTDLCLKWPNRKLILDCKFYQQSLVENHNQAKARSAHLYQLYAYLRNQARHPGWENTAGVLLYPEVDRDFDFTYRLSGHPVRLVSLNLNQDWRAIEHRLCDILLTVPGEKNNWLWSIGSARCGGRSSGRLQRLFQRKRPPRIGG